MDAYEATRVVFSRVQALDPENAAKIMGLLLIQDHGEKEMIRLAFGPEGLLQNVVLKARKDLGLQVHQQPVSSSSTSSSPATPSSAAPGPTPSPLFLARQNSASRLLHPSPLAVSSPTSWAPPPVFSRSNSTPCGALNGSMDDLQCSDELISPGNPNPSPFYNGASDLIDELQLQDQLSFLNDQSAGIPGSNYPLSSKTAVNDLIYSENDCRSPSAGVGADGMLYPYGMGWGANGQHRRSFSATDACLGSDAAAGLGWKPCLYYARGYCKNGAACRFVHGLPDETTAAAVAAATAGAKMDAVVEQQCQELLLRAKSSPRVGGGGMSQLMASAFPYSPTGSLPHSPSASSKCLSFLLQQQQNESQRAAAAATAAALMLGGDDNHKFMGRSRLERSDFNPGSRQIYLTFPADSTFREEDVSNYFSIYGPVQDVRIPYQQKRMFGFVTFVYPETVKLILAKGNPHFVCDARVLVKPYKEKGKVPDKYRKQQQQQQAERGDFSGCTTPTGMDSRDPFDLQHLGARMLYNNSSTQELLLRRRLEQQQQALKLQQAIELQGRRFMGLQLLDLKSRSLSSSAPVSINSPTTNMTSSTPTTIASNGSISSSSPEESPPEEKSPIAAAPPPPVLKESSCHGFLHQTAVNAADKEESACHDSDFQDGAEHNLPDSPFASPTKSSAAHAFMLGEADMGATNGAATNNGINSHLISSTLLPPTATLDMASLKSCFFQVPRFSGHGAIGM